MTKVLIWLVAFAAVALNIFQYVKYSELQDTYLEYLRSDVCFFQHTVLMERIGNALINQEIDRITFTERWMVNGNTFATHCKRSGA